jgi:uracil-DNA glycosylase
MPPAVWNGEARQRTVRIMPALHPDPLERRAVAQLFQSPMQPT